MPWRRLRPRTSRHESRDGGAGQIAPEIIAKYFEMGLMGIEVPETRTAARAARS